MTSFLGLAGHQQSFLEVEIQSPDMELELLPFGSLIHRIISQVLASDFRTEYQFTSPNDSGIGGIRNWNKEEDMLKKVEMGKNPKECFIEMSKNEKMQDGLGSKMM